jgi:Outer membrane protein beta-barrel domain
LLGLTLATSAGACVGDSIGDRERVRFGAGGGLAIASVKLNRDSPSQTVPELKDGTGESLYVEAGAEEPDSSMLLCRLVYAQTEHEVKGFHTDADLRQWTVQALFSPVILGPGQLRFRPLLGVGGGVMQLDYQDDRFLRDQTGFTWSIIIGLDVHLLRTVVLGATAGYGGFDHWGDTLGEVASAQVHAGVRF